ncbi:MAG: RNA pseudouridine synthase [Treponematales bacterium]
MKFGSPALAPSVVETAPDYLVVYKPPRTHCAPLPGGGPSLFEWCAASFPEVSRLRGRGRGEGGLVHRLDYETRGLVLIARNQRALDSFLRQQEEGTLVKEYEALSSGQGLRLPGFPPLPEELSLELKAPLVIESLFRPYGPGRKAVRPVSLRGEGGGGRRAKEIAVDRGGPYKTEILAAETEGCRAGFTVRLRRGFRHQVRCHLAWLGYPLLNDSLYGGAAEDDGFLGLRAQRLSFLAPASGERRTCAAPPEI